ncbi:MAG TPA: hypothetical protein VFZ16_11995, partial [Hyphomicrobiaceae bacterium]|nr:hypothetical protein [Hyphomicrobiaceae bacterium]
MDLQSLARGYFEAGGFQVGREAPGFLDLTHPEARNDRPTRVLLWSDGTALAPSRELSAADRAAREARESALLAAFAREMAAAPGAIGYYLVASLAGLSASFARSAPALLQGGGIRVPIQMFDTDYKVDTSGGSRVRSVLARVLDRAERVRRVTQPFRIRRGLGPDDCIAGAADLVEHLETALRDPGQGARLRIIDGSAGSGKSIAFNALLASCFNEFRAAKAQHGAGRRPIAFLPEHIRGEAIGYVDDVLDAAADADMARAVEPEQLRWLLKNGFSLWMFDGLDEFYAGDNDFFAFLEAELTDPGSQAQILVCTRDSLLTSSAAMRAFIERQQRCGGSVEIFELAHWDTKAWAEIAWLELEGGREGARNSPAVAGFVAALQAAPMLAELARLPFYCTVMLDAYKAEGSMPKDELELLQWIVNRMVDREHGKDIFRWRDFIDVDALSEEVADAATGLLAEGADTTHTRAILAEVLDGDGRLQLFELIEAVAHQQRRNPATAADGLGVDELRNLYGRLYASANLADPDVERLLTVLVQFAFFGAGRHAGTVDFTHHILADYLAGRYAVRLLRDGVRHNGARPSASDTTLLPSPLSDARRPINAFRQAIGTAPFVAGSPFHRTLASGIDADP